jgi:hypothetical protein
MVMDNPSYHFMIVVKALASNSKKADPVLWLSGMNILYDQKQNKLELNC